MPVKIRLARHGRKRTAYYHIVVADSRSPRDGRIIERIGSYNPITNPATIELDFDKALSWLIDGAQPTETAKTILSYKGVLMKKHLLEGVKKGAFDETEAERRYQAWKQEKDAKIIAKIDKLASEVNSDLTKRLKAEAKVKEARASEIARKNSKLAAQLSKESEVTEEVVETPEMIDEKIVESPEVITEEVVETPEVIAEKIVETPEVVAEEITAVQPEEVSDEETAKEAEA
jgi:small subunit ribosomal protein S16